MITEMDLQTIREASEEIRRTVVGDRPRGCCYDASMRLGSALESRGIASVMITGSFRIDAADCLMSHCWLRLMDNETIVDVTGDQFNEDLEVEKIPEIVIAPLDNYPRYNEGSISRRFEPSIDAPKV